MLYKELLNINEFIINIITIIAIALITLNCVLSGLIPNKKLDKKNTIIQIII
jgi:hypothetical protein